MYSSSSQRKFWTFRNDEELARLRYNANSTYVKNIKNPKQKEELSQFFLTADEELIIVRHYEKVMRDFFQNFMPRQELLPTEVKGTAFHFYKRFFIVSSIMDYHPKEIMITCIFLSCKICEYMVPIDLFVRHIEGDKNLLKNIILDQELEVLARINFQIHVVNPYRAIEGLMLDLRTRGSLHSSVKELYEHINRFMNGMWFTDACLLYSPTQIALAAVMHAASRCKENIDNFIMNVFLNCPPPSALNSIIKIVREIRTRVMNLQHLPAVETVVQLETRLARCRNPHNNPSSEVFKTRMKEYALEAYASSSPLVSK